MTSLQTPVLHESLLRLPTVLERTGLGRATIWRRIKAGQFPPPQRISVRCVAWRKSILEAWMRGEWQPTNGEQREAA